VRTAASPLVGLQEVEDTPPDAILLDLRMPFVNGVGFLYRLRAQSAHRYTPVAIITGDSCIDDPALNELHGLDAEVRFKPMWIDEVVTLTRSLLARGLRVTALEPGDQLIGVAEENLKDAGDVEFIHARLEDMQLPRDSYEAVFSASAIHWVDPDLSWRKIADALAPNGTLALIQYFGLQEQRSVDDQEALLSALHRHAPEIAATWPTYRDLDHTIAGVHERRRNVTDAWGWLGSYDIGRDYAADLFEDLQLATVPTLIEHTAGELGALLGTMSFWARLSPDQRDALARENQALHERLGRPIRASTLAALLTARRSAPAPQR